MVGMVVCSDWVSDESIDLACGRRIGDAFDEHTDIKPPPRKTDGEVEQMPIAPQKHKKGAQVNFLNILKQTRPQHQI